MIRKLVLILMVAFPTVAASQDKASETDPIEQYRVEATEKWDSEIVKLEAQDRSQPDPQESILFIGSSSIRRWTDLDADLSPRKTVNRGYGGAKFSDLAVYIDRIVNPHQFKALVIFVGNDIVGKPEDKTPAEVARLFKYIVGQVRKTHATQPIFLLAVTPTPSRFKAWPTIRQANAELAKVCESEKSVYFIPTEKFYLDEAGKPIEKYFVEDQLHQNREGYQVWSRIVREHLDRVLGATDEPHKTGWPLTEEERSYVLRPEHERRPGHESNKHLPAMWPVVASAGSWGGTSWLDTHAKLVEYVKANPGPCDVLLVGDSITQQWGSPLDEGVLNAAWQKYFADYKTINIGIGGDKTQNVLWRLDHGGVDGLLPRVIIIMIGNNNMFFTPETGIESAARGVQVCIANLREKFPQADILAVKILPCHAPGNKFYEDIKLTNAALDSLKLDSDPKVTVVDLTDAYIHGDGKLKQELFTADNIHLSLAGYHVYAERLKPILNEKIGVNGLR